MAAVQLVGNSPELVSVEQAHAVASRERRERFRELIAQYLAGPSTPSNFEAMVEAMQRETGAAPDCTACNGRGFRPLRREVVDHYDEQEERRLEEIKRLEQQAREAEVPDEHEGAGFKTRQIVTRLVKTTENLTRDRRERNRRSICRKCRGTGKGARPHDLDPAHPDSMFSTVMCPACRGVDARNERKRLKKLGGGPKYPSLMHRHHGTSCGYVVRELPENVSGPRQQLPCLRCSGELDDVGPGYLVPINARPTLRTNNVAEEPRGVDELPEHFPASDFGDEEPDRTQPEGWLEALRVEDPKLAAGVAAYLSPQADGYADHPWGRRFALWPLTEPGRQLAGDAGDFDCALEACDIAREAEASCALGSPRRRMLISEANQAARALERRVEAALRAAEEVWLP